MSLGERIRSLRTERNLSQNDLAEALKVSRQSISKWETDGAIPDLDKLLALSELFGISLDSLVKGAPLAPAIPPAAPEPSGPAPAARCPAPHRLAGIMLLCFGALAAILLCLLGGGLLLPLLYASPFLLCGLVCLLSRKRTGLWCGWAIYLCVDSYLRLAAGVTWGIIWLTAQFTPEMNYTRLAVGWGQFLLGVLLIALTLWSYRKETAACDRRHAAFVGAALLLLVGVSLVQNGLLQSRFAGPYNSALWLLVIVDYLKLGAFVALLRLVFALLRQRRIDKKTI